MDLFAEFLRVFGGFADAIRGVMGGWIYPEKLSNPPRGTFLLYVRN
jgi:hypothetical protein